MFLCVRATPTVSNWAIVIINRASHLPHGLGQPCLFHRCYLQFRNQDLGVPLDLREGTEKLRIVLFTPSRGPPDRFWLPSNILAKVQSLIFAINPHLLIKASLHLLGSLLRRPSFAKIPTNVSKMCPKVKKFWYFP